MHLFTQYIEPLIAWLHTHPQAALFITFLIAMMESFAIIGSIIPGSVTMTAIGILAGSGILRIDLTLLAATLGAIAGDGVSYLLGFFYSERLRSLWPFSRYPTLLAYGLAYFEKHGGKSVLIGRFVGPLRSIIPVIAGMMHMPQWRFFITNILSGIGWALLYVTPGILIGAASHELSPERATRLILLILFILIGLWIASLGIKSVLSRTLNWLQSLFHRTWSMALTKPYFHRLVRCVTPNDEKDHASTANLCLLLVLSTSIFLFLLYLQLYGQTLILDFNEPIHLFLQSVRTRAFDLFFAISAQLVSPISFMSLFVSMCFYMIYKQDIKGLFQWLGLGAFSALFLFYTQQHVPSFGPSGILEPKPEHAFPSTELFYSTSYFLSLILHSRHTFPSLGRALFSFILFFSLILGILSILYLGDNWCDNSIAALFSGSSFALSYWLIYRKTHPRERIAFPSWVGICILACATTLSCFLNLNPVLLSHATYFKQHVLSESIWWNQERPILPLHSKNRLGQFNNTFNVQYVGELDTLQSALILAGWKKKQDSLFRAVLKKVDGKHPAPIPLFPTLYLNKKPKLTLVYQSEPNMPLIQLQLWRSNYYLDSLNQPIWLGSVQTLPLSKNHYPYTSQDTALKIFSKTLPEFKKHKRRFYQRTHTHLLLLLQSAPTE